MDEWIKSVLQYGSGPIIAAGALLWQQARTDRRDEKRTDRETEERAKDRVHERELAEADRSARLTELSETLRQSRELADAEQVARLTELSETLRQNRELADAEQAARLAELTETLARERQSRDEEKVAEKEALWRSERREMYSGLIARQKDVEKRLMEALYSPELTETDDNFLPGQTAKRTFEWDEERDMEQQVAEIQLLGSEAAGKAASSMIFNAIHSADHAYFATQNPEDDFWTRANSMLALKEFQKASGKFIEAVRRDLGVDT